MFSIDLLGIDLTAFAVFSGALGLAVGFGLQKTVGNLIAGIILLMDRSIKPGDVIVVGDSFGWVNKIGVRAVSVVTRDGKTFTGRFLNQDTFSVQLIDANDKLVSIDKATVRESTLEKTSPMPSFKDKLTSQELADVVSYLVSLRGRP